jgi:glycosyltransferase involved in cell wall biosynthesis
MADLFERPVIATEPISVLLLVENLVVELEEVLRSWIAYLDSLAREYEIVLVENGSSNSDAGPVEGLIASQPRLRILRHVTRRGVGAALRAGLQVAQHPLLCYAECSPSYQPTDLALFLQEIDKVDVVSGYRVWQTRQPRWHWQQMKARFLARLLFGIRLRDVECSFKLFRRSVFARIPIQSDGPFVHTEVLAKANFLSCLMAEVPVTYRGSSSKEIRPASPEQRRAELWRVFHHPDFGPAVLPGEAPVLPTEEPT